MKKTGHFRKPLKERQRMNINLLVQQEQERRISVTKRTENEDFFLQPKGTVTHLLGVYLAGVLTE